MYKVLIMSSKLPIIDVFKNSFIVPQYRQPTCEEFFKSGMNQNLRIETGITTNYTNYIDLIKYLAPNEENKDEENNKTNDIMSKCIKELPKYREFIKIEKSKNTPHTRLPYWSEWIDNELKNSREYKIWLDSMPMQIPNSLSSYQQNYPHYNLKSVDDDINRIDHKLSDGQKLIHGGFWFSSDDEIITERPLSATFCPDIALQLARHGGKAYNNDRVDIMLLTVVNPKTNVFVFNMKEGAFGDEKEVLFASGATLKKKSATKIGTIMVGKENVFKAIPVYLLEVEIS